MIDVNIQNTYVPPYLKSDSFLNNRIGFWGTVCKVRPDTHKVDVLMDIGQIVESLPVMSNIWVMNNEDSKVVSGRRNLPPVGSFVFCLMPTHTVTGAFVLCSGIPYSNDFSSNFLCDENDSEKMKDFSLTETETQLSGWVTQKRRDNADILITSPTDDVHLNIIHDKDDEKKDLVELKIFNTLLKIQNDTDNGVSISIGNNDSEVPITLNVEGKLNATVKGESAITGKNSITVNCDKEIKIVSSQKLTIQGQSGKIEVS